jgi:hypothetical protein
VLLVLGSAFFPPAVLLVLLFFFVVAVCGTTKRLGLARLGDSDPLAVLGRRGGGVQVLFLTPLNSFGPFAERGAEATVQFVGLLVFIISCVFCYGYLRQNHGGLVSVVPCWVVRPSEFHLQAYRHSGAQISVAKVNKNRK